MMSDCANPEGVPPSLLAAYADGELGPEEAAAVETWLAGHPDGAAEVEALRRLGGLWQATAAPDPSEVAWEALRARIELALPPASARRTESRARTGSAGLAWWLGSAAAVLAVVLLGRAFWPTGGGEPAEEPFPVATAAEVNILHIGAEDADGLVVGHPPVVGPLEFAAAADVRVVKVEPFGSEGPVARLEEGAVPMMWPADDAEEP